jgi:hypothetical protein
MLSGILNRVFMDQAKAEERTLDKTGVCVILGDRNGVRNSFLALNMLNWQGSTYFNLQAFLRRLG